MKLQYIKPSLTTVEVEMHERLLMAAPSTALHSQKFLRAQVMKSARWNSSSTPFGVMIPRQTKATCSPLGNFTHFSSR